MFSPMGNAMQYYSRMIVDHTRNDAYWQAIHQVVKPGMIVADVGTGQGLLAMMAAKAGAAKVYAIERVQGSQSLAEHLIAANGLADVVEIIKGDAEQVVLPQPIDALVSEVLGNVGIDEGVHPIYRAFLANNPVPPENIIPQRVRAYLQPLQLTTEHVGPWRRSIHGIDLSPAIALLDQPCAMTMDLRKPQKPLAPPILIEDIRPGREDRDHPETWTVGCTIAEDGILDGVAAWFDCMLTGDVTFDILPRPDSSWGNAFWTVEPTLTVKAGDHLELHVDRQGTTHHRNWVIDYALNGEEVAA